MSFKLDQILSSVMLIFVPVRIMWDQSLQVHANHTTHPEESRKICIVLTGIIQPHALVILLTWSTRTPITAKCVILISILCSIVVNGDIPFLPTGLHSQSHNDLLKPLILLKQYCVQTLTILLLLKCL